MSTPLFFLFKKPKKKKKPRLTVPNFEISHVYCVFMCVKLKRGCLFLNALNAA